MAHRKKAAATGIPGPRRAHPGPRSTPRRCCTASKPGPPSTSRDGSIWGRRRVLLLNSTYEPLTALPMRRAVVMLMCGKADVVHDDPSGPVIHSATRTIVVPSVIRLRSYVRVPYRARIPMTRAALMHRDRFRCAYCGCKADTVDHVVPRSRGGDHTWENCVAACSTCNHRKADRLLAELGWSLRSTPTPAEGSALAAAVDGQGTRPGVDADIWVRARPSDSPRYGLLVSIALAHSLLGGVPLATPVGLDRADLGRRQEPQGPAPGDLQDVREVDP